MDHDHDPEAVTIARAVGEAVDRLVDLDRIPPARLAAHLVVISGRVAASMRIDDVTATEAFLMAFRTQVAEDRDERRKGMN